MSKILWFLNRAAAGIIAAATTGLIFGVVSTLYGEARVGDNATRGHLPEILVFYGGISAFYAALIGSPSGILVICLSRARIAPWPSLPLLILGASAGLLAAFALINTRISQPNAILLLLTIGATVGGIITSFFLRGNRFAIAPQDDKV